MSGYITPRHMLRDRIEDRIREMGAHIDARSRDADFVLISCYEFDCTRTSKQVPIDGVPRAIWPDLLLQAAKGWGLNASGDFICDACARVPL